MHRPTKEGKTGPPTDGTSEAGSGVMRSEVTVRQFDVSLFIPDPYKITFINLYYFRCLVKLSEKKGWMRNIPNKTIAALQLKTMNTMRICDFL